LDCIKIKPSLLKGEISIPPSKSLCHRAIICAALSNEESKIDNVNFSDDIIATCKGMKILGAKIERIDDTLIIRGSINALTGETIDCNESGSTLRFLIPIALVQPANIRFVGRGKLVSRPLDIYYNIFEKQDILYSNDMGNLPLNIEGQFKPGNFAIEGNISSQFISGLLFSLPLLDGDSKIIITTNLESKGYVDLTLDMLNRYGIEIINNGYKEFIIKGNQRYKGRDYRVEGDYSQAAFWLVGGILGEEITSRNLNLESLQGDRVIIDIINKMGGTITLDETFIKTIASNTKGIIIDASQCPDLVPVLAVLAALSNGQTKIVNAARVRIKESDRLNAIATELNKLGADVREFDDGLVINGKDSLIGGVVDSWNDHRIAMALAIASIKCKDEIIIKNSEAVKKSYPHFWEDFKKLGGKIDEFNMGK
jgi:3-phosphoshikimate 1-carboxyvinyltransferase